MLAKVIVEQLPKSIVVVNQLDEKLRQSYVYKVAGLKQTWFNKLISILGMNPEGKHFSITEEARSHYFTTKHFRKFNGSLLQFAAGQIPDWMARSVEKVFSINGIYTIAINYHDTPLGNVMIFYCDQQMPEFGNLEQVVDVASEQIYHLIGLNKASLNIPSLKDQFTKSLLNNITHEIRTPLNGILGLLEAAELYQQSSDGSNLELINGIWKNARQLLNNIENIILASELENNTCSFTFERYQGITLVEMIDLVVNRFEKEYPDREIFLNVESPGNQLFLFDRCKLEFVVDELINNGLKFSDSRLEVNVKFGDAFLLEVKDFGIGMSDIEQSVVFQRFSRVASSNKMYRGVGLGLANVYQIVERHRGRITIISHPGAGTAMTLKLSSIENNDTLLLN
jgi:signal transduction histidine kinase